jgi:hypothetical protein
MAGGSHRHWIFGTYSPKTSVIGSSPSRSASAARLHGRDHHLANRLEYDPELPVVLRFQDIELPRELRRRLESMATPCSVKAQGWYFR